MWDRLCLCQQWLKNVTWRKIGSSPRCPWGLFGLGSLLHAAGPLWLPRTGQLLWKKEEEAFSESAVLWIDRPRLRLSKGRWQGRCHFASPWMLISILDPTTVTQHKHIFWRDNKQTALYRKMTMAMITNFIIVTRSRITTTAATGRRMTRTTWCTTSRSWIWTTISRIRQVNNLSTVLGWKGGP